MEFEVRFEQRLALAQRQAGEVAPFQLEQVEDVDEDLDPVSRASRGSLIPSRPCSFSKLVREPSKATISPSATKSATVSASSASMISG